MDTSAYLPLFGDQPALNDRNRQHDEEEQNGGGGGEADALLVATPEYNYSVPGVLKNAIDWASRPAYASVFKGKPCLIVTTSGGVMGGVRAQAHLKYILNGMLSVVHPGKEIIVTQANTKVKDGKLEDEAVLGFIDEEMTGFLASLG